MKILSLTPSTSWVLVFALGGGLIACSGSDDDDNLVPIVDTGDDVPDTAVAVCGNGVIDTDERCDGDALGGATCVGEGFDGGVLSCTSGCELDVSACTIDVAEERCGDGVRQGDEACDGDDLNVTCQDEGFSAGEVSCTEACAVSFEGCYNTSICGNGELEASEECDDGNTVDNDGCSFDCRTERCGDSIVQEGEHCDTEGAVLVAWPDASVGVARCEACALVELVCDTDQCGDGIIQFDESCDDGNTESGDGCSSTCVTETCDGVLDANEVCDGEHVAITCQDLGFDTGETACSETCSLVLDGCGFPGCTGDDCVVPCFDPVDSDGDGIGDACDACPEVANDGGACPVVCGDGEVGDGEVCDDGSVEIDPCPYGESSCSVCNTTCTGEVEGSSTSYCGDSVVDTANGESCDDGNTDNTDGCTNGCQLSVCGDGYVQSGEECDDGNLVAGDGCSSCILDECNARLACPGVAVCEAVSCVDYQCVVAPAADNTPCDDGSPCTTGDVCSGGVCGGVERDCSSLNGNCTVGECNASTGACEVTPVADNTACDDGSPCTTGDMCSGGVCGGVERDCSSLNGSCTVGECNASTGACEVTLVADNTLCDDGIRCTTGDQCVAGVCSGTPADEFCPDDGNPCTDEICVGAGGGPDGCSHVNNTAPCDDGLYCMTADTCVDGSCVGTVPRDCSFAGTACALGVCNETAAQCEQSPFPDGTLCDDGASCSTGDQCVSGVCLGTADDGACAVSSVPSCEYEVCSPSDTSDPSGCVVDSYLTGDLCWDPPSVALTCGPTVSCTCGNGVLDPGEECDDFNTLPGDGCSNECKLELDCNSGFSIVNLAQDATPTATGWVYDLVGLHPLAHTMACGETAVATNEQLFVYNAPRDTYLTLKLSVDGSPSAAMVGMMAFENCVTSENAWACADIGYGNSTMDVGFVRAGQSLFVSIQVNDAASDPTILHLEGWERRIIPLDRACDVTDPFVICEQGTICDEASGSICARGCNDNGLCDEGEDAMRCPADCSNEPFCGDHYCNPLDYGPSAPLETCLSCPQDCGPCAPQHGDGVCTVAPNFRETCTTAPLDCLTCVVPDSCGNGDCELWEDSLTCFTDCGLSEGCGDGTCDLDGGESCVLCPADCGTCGTSGECVVGADPAFCSVQMTSYSCPVVCGDPPECPHRLDLTAGGDGVCQPRENAINCPADCQ